jgi:tellurite resistance protein
MSLYDALQAMDASDLEELGEQYAALGYTALGEQFEELATARRRTEHAVWDQQYRASADYEAASAVAYADSLTEELEKALLRLFPGIRTLEPAPVGRAA